MAAEGAMRAHLDEVLRDSVVEVGVELVDDRLVLDHREEAHAGGEHADEQQRQPRQHLRTRSDRDQPRDGLTRGLLRAILRGTRPLSPAGAGQAHSCGRAFLAEPGGGDACLRVGRREQLVADDG